jgi:uncharacterized membrane protein YfcA
MPLELWHYPLLFFVGLIAGTVDAVAGGGGLITVPALLNLGLPVPLALGTNKFQSSFGSVSASVHFVRCGAVTLRECRLGILMTLLGALLGAVTVQQIDADLLHYVVPWLLIAILLYTLLRPSIGIENHPPKIPAPLFFTAFGLGLGFYDGFFGPGTGSFWAIALVLLLGQNFTRATAFTKIMNATSNLASLALFAAAGLVHLGAGATMAAGQLVGGRLGAGLVVTRGARLIRPVFLIVVSLTLARLLWVSYAK